MTTRARPAVNVTLPRALRAAYQEACVAHPDMPTLAALLEGAVRVALAGVGWPVPPAEEPSTRTAAATAARVAEERRRR